MSSLSLVLILHQHLPPGTPERTLDALYTKLYKPILLHLRRLEKVKLNLHVNGFLFSRLLRRDPDYLALVRHLVEARRLELMGGGWSDPFLFGVPERDAIGQLQWQAQLIQRNFQQRPTAAWLAEMAWDPSLPRILQRAGIRSAVIGEGALGEQADPHGIYVTEREGAPLLLFPADSALSGRYERDLAEALTYLDRQRKARAEILTWALSLADVNPLDPLPTLRKLGRCLSALDASDHWVKTLRFEEATQKIPPRGRIYPAAWFPWGESWEASLVRYEAANRLHKRMLQVSLEVHRLRSNARQNAAAREALEAATAALYQGQAHDACWHGPRLGVYDPALRHTAWASLLAAETRVYRALKRHKTVHHVRVDYDCDGAEELIVRSPKMGAVLHLARGGSLVELGVWSLPGNLMNVLARRVEPYHGALERHLNLPMLILDEEFDESTEDESTEDDFSEDAPLDPDTEELLLQELPRFAVEIEDETFSEETAPIMMPGRTGGAQRSAGRRAGGATVQLRPPGARPPTPPTPPDPRELLAKKLCFDGQPRSSFVDHFLPTTTTLDQLRQGQYLERGDFAHRPYRVLSSEVHEILEAFCVSLSREGHVSKAGDRDRLIQVAKRYIFHKEMSGLDVRYDIANRYHTPLEALFAVEINLGLDGLGDEHQLYLQGAPVASLRDPLDAPVTTWAAMVDDDRGYRVTLTTPQEARLLSFPVETIARGRTGLKMIAQGVCWFVAWPVCLWGEERTSFDISLHVERSR